jgi:hypothetical protein
LRLLDDTEAAAPAPRTSQAQVDGEVILDLADRAARLFDIRRITIEADTTSGTVKTAEKLAGMIEDFKTREDGWYDDVLIGRMIGLAKQTGDVTRNPVTLKTMSFDQDNFWTAHFGGLYIFRGVPHPAAIAAGDKDGLGDLPIPFVFDFNDHKAIAKFLELNDLAEPIVKARGIDAAAILHQKMDFVVAEVAAAMGESLDGATRRDLRLLGRRHAKQLPAEWQGLAAMARWAEEDGDWPHITSDHPAYFYTLRATQHPDADLVNMLLSELSPLDIRQLFICHKEAFYRAYATWPEQKKDYVADFLSLEYQVDKTGTRAALFGHEDAMEQPIAPVAGPWTKTGRRDDLIARVGPWGAVGKR